MDNASRCREVFRFSAIPSHVDAGKVTNLDRGAPDGHGQLSDRTARGRSAYPGCVRLQRAPGQGQPSARSSSSSTTTSLGPLLDAVQQANQQDVGRQVVHPAVHQDATLRAAQLVPGADDVLQAAAAEGVLARQHLGRGVQALQAHRALQQIQQRRGLVHVRGEGEHLGFQCPWGRRGDWLVYRGKEPGAQNILGGGPAAGGRLGKGGWGG